MVTNLQTSCRINHNKTKIKKKGKQLPCTMNKLPCTMNSTTKLLLLLYLLTTTFYLTSTYSSSSSSSSSTTFSLLKPATSSTTLLAVSDPTPVSSVDVKVYVYDLPPEYNSGWLAEGRCSRHLFAAEVALHRAVTGSRRFRATDPSEADFFLVPVYVSCNFSAVNGFPALGHARGLLESAVRRVAGEMPYWNRSNGADHVFVASHDYGACFRAMEDKAIADGIPSFMKNSIILQTFGVNYPHPCQDVENILIPPYVSPEAMAAAAEESLAGRERDIWAFFRGKMEVHPKNISGHFYSRRVRTEIWNRFGRDRRFYLRRKRFAGYQSEIARSVFCLCPLGWAPWSPRLVESVALGCVPVIIADGIRLPFPDAVPWPAISLTVPERDVPLLDRILDHVAATNLSDIQRNLKDPAVQQALMFHDGIRVGDAAWQVLIGLSKKVDRSFRRRVFPRGEIRLDGI